jgi:hypothetical protein
LTGSQAYRKRRISGTSYAPTNNHFNIIKDNAYIKGVTLPSTLTSIGYYTFYYCSGLTSVTIPEGVTSIGYEAFAGCSGLTSVTIPGSVTSIAQGAFYGCSDLTSVTIGEGVTSIEVYAFSDCSGLTSVTIPSSVTSIDSDAFSGCSGLTAFIVAESNTAYSAQDGILYNKTKTTLISVPRAKSGALDNLPNTLTSIGSSAFYYCTGLTSVTIPGSVTSIGSDAFFQCRRLTSVIFGAGSNITTAWNNNSFPDNGYGENGYGYTGDSLWTGIHHRQQSGDVYPQWHHLDATVGAEPSGRLLVRQAHQPKHTRRLSKQTK